MRGDDKTFQQLYPDQFYDSYLNAGHRPDGRPMGQARETTVGLGAVMSAASSSLVKIGETTVIAGISLSVISPSDECPEDGKLDVVVEIHPMSSPQTSTGKPQNRAAVLMQRLRLYLIDSYTVDLSQLCIQKSSAAWSLCCNICVLSDDGALLDACLLAAVSSLSHLQLPSVCIMPSGQVVPAGDKNAIPELIKEGKPLRLQSIPISLTCGTRGRHLVADPTLEEEALLDSQTSIVLDQDGNVLGLHKPGGAPLQDEVLQDCIEAARLRYTVLSGLMQQALELQP
mmetsp:Transcript_24463/g.68020  ORF Transcript_24463/g.68020 Transcript_24463/m.68020 type:complete len:285 (-) Transcript_24463:148-1002(-)